MITRNGSPARTRFISVLTSTLVGCLFFSPSLSTLSAATVYDLKTDWSDSVNPNGPWTYREGNNALPHVADWQGLSGDFTGVQPAWARFETGSSNLPPWMKIASPAGIVNDWQLGDIVTHSTDGFNGIGSGLSNVIWTSPLNGTIDVSGATWMGRDIGRGNHWDISLNGVSLTAGDIFSGDPYNRASPFAFSAGSGGATVLNQIPVVIGDVVRLQFTKTSGPGDYAGINLTITAVPEPTSIVLFAVPAAIWGLCRRRGSETPRGHGTIRRNAMITRNGSRTLFPGALTSACALLGFVGASARAEMIYSAADDFSKTSNPNGVWSYGTTGTTLNGTFTVHTSAVTSISNIPNWDGWRGTQPMFGNFYPFTAKYTGAAPAGETDVVILPGMLTQHPAPDGGYSVVRFTAPTTDTYLLSSVFEGREFQGQGPGTNADVHVLRNGVALFNGVVMGFGAASDQPFATSLNLTAGDRVDFSVGYGTNSTFLGDTLSLQATLTVPEPTSLALFGIPAAIWALRRRRA